MNDVLLIYELIPEDIVIYLLQANYQDLNKLKTYHRKYINCDIDVVDVNWLLTFLEHHSNDIIAATEPYVLHGITTVICTGFLL